MAENPLIAVAKKYIEQRLFQTKRKFELLLPGVKDAKKKQSMQETIKEVERDIKKLQSGMFEINDLTRYNITAEDIESHRSNTTRRKSIGEYKILRNINVEHLNDYSTNSEVNSIWSYLQFFGKEYLGLLSEQNLKLDYAHSYTRDNFFTLYNETIRVFERYGELLEQINNADGKGNAEYRERLISIQGKSYRDIIMRSGKFLYSLHNFIEEIFDAENEGQQVIVEPNKIVEISGEHSTITGITSLEALQDLNDFVNEFIDFTNVPEIKRIEEE